LRLGFTSDWNYRGKGNIAFSQKIGRFEMAG
jgi:hypothetical protein